MLSRRSVSAMMIVLALSAMLATPTAAVRPAPSPSLPPSGEPPLTPEAQGASDRKVAGALAYVAEQDRQGRDLVSLACVTPTAAPRNATAGGFTTDACYVPQGYLPVSARDQTKWFYCGPAVGQVIANYSWAVPATADKYSQAKIAEWMKTDINGLTNGSELIAGLEKATVGSPRRPSVWAWVITELRDHNGNGATGDELQAFVRSNVSDSKMPLAVPVKPHSPTSNYNLASWPNPVNSTGHWIALYGWYSPWTGTDFARVYFTDSSRDEGGSTGKYWNSTKSMAALIGEHTRRLVW